MGVGLAGGASTSTRGYGRFVSSALIGIAIVIPWIAVETLWAVLSVSEPSTRWWTPAAIPASLVTAVLAALAAQRWVRGAGSLSAVALAGGGTLGYFVGRMLVRVIWEHAFFSPGITVRKVAAVLFVALAAAIGACVMVFLTELSERKGSGAQSVRT